MTQEALATASMQEDQGAADYNDLSLNFMNLIEDRFSCRSKNPTAFCRFFLKICVSSKIHVEVQKPLCIQRKYLLNISAMCKGYKKYVIRQLLGFSYMRTIEVKWKCDMIAGMSCSWVVLRVNWEAEAPNLSCLSPDYTFCTIKYPRVRVTKVLSSFCQCICCVWTYLGLQLFCLCLLLLTAVYRQVVVAFLLFFFVPFQTNANLTYLIWEQSTDYSPHSTVQIVCRN